MLNSQRTHFSVNWDINEIALIELADNSQYFYLKRNCTLQYQKKSNQIYKMNNSSETSNVLLDDIWQATEVNFSSTFELKIVKGYKVN